MPHEVSIPGYVIDRIMAKRGKLSVYDSFEPKGLAAFVEKRKPEFKGK